MQKHIDNAAVVSIDGSRVKHGRGVLLATAKCAFGKAQIVAFAIIFGGETGASMRALYEELGLKGKQQVRDDGTCYDRRWLQIMVDDNVYWVLCALRTVRFLAILVAPPSCPMPLRSR
jgi:hypothetical protein